MTCIAIRNTLVLSSLITLDACADTHDPRHQQAFIAGHTLSLVNDGGQCALSLDSQAPLMLDMKWPCDFSPDRKGMPRIETFHDIPIVIAQHSNPEPAPGSDCDSQQQAVRLIEGRLESSIVIRFANCLNGPVDQKNFTALFHW